MCGGGADRRFRCHRRGRVNAPFVHQLKQLQPRQQLAQLSRLQGAQLVILHLPRHRCLAADGAQRAAEVREIFAGAQLVFQRFAQIAVLQPGIYRIQRAEPVQQIQRRFFAHPRYPGNVVAGVAHQRFQVDQLLRLQAVFFLDCGAIEHRRFGVSHFGCCQQHRHLIAHQLQRIPVAGGDKAFAARVSGRRR